MLNRVILNRAVLNKASERRYKSTSNEAEKYTVDDLIQMGYLTAYGNENEGYRIDTAQPLPMPIRDIKDFDAVFIGRSVPASVDTQRACMFNLSNKSHLTESQQKEIISKYNNKPNDRAISQLLFRNYTLPNADLKIIQNKTTEDSWQYSHKMFEGSTFNNVELNIKGSISSANKLFMSLKCNELEIYTNSISGDNVVAGTDVIAPHDTTEMYASSAINKYPRGVSYYRGLANWAFTNNWDGNATEIPNVRGVETEEDRITSPINVMKLPSGILYQTLWISSITRIGPVLDVTNVTGSEYLWGNCGIQLPNVTDVRIKGLNNLDWDFRGGATDKAFIPKMDEDSIIYCLNNVVEQTGTTRNIYFSTEVIKPTYEGNSAKLKDALSNASTKGWNVYCGDTALIIPDTPPVGNYIQFEDPAVEAICVANWSSDGIGLTMEDAAAVTSLESAFRENSEITTFDELSYFSQLKILNGYAFYNCTNLHSVNLANIEVVYGNSLAGTAITDLYLPSVVTLGNSGIQNMKSIRKIHLGPNLTTIEQYNFWGYTTGGSIDVIIEATTPPSLAGKNQPGWYGVTFYVPDASLEAYKGATNWNTYADRIHPLSEIEGSPYIQFEDAEVERILMSKGVSSDGIGITKEDAAAVTSLNAMFNGNSAITSFDELRYFTGLTTMSNDFPATYVGEFYNCTNLQRVTIPANVSKVLNYTFYKCTSLQSVTFEDASRITELGQHAFSNTAIGGDIAFPNLEKATSPFHSTGIERVLDLGKITSIDGISSGYGSSFLNNSASLRMLYLPASLTALNGFAIGKCSALATIVSLATTPPTLSPSAFNGCGAITGIYVPDASVDAYKTSWSAHAGKIKPLSELNA